MPTSPDVIFAHLHALGAGEFAHPNGSLVAHLRGTESLLREWGGNDTLCAASLYHAVYGTDGYQTSLTGLDMRQRIAGLIGTEAEQLVYLYGACHREVFYPRIGTPEQLTFSDRFSNSEYAIRNSLSVTFPVSLGCGTQIASLDQVIVGSTNRISPLPCGY